MWMPGWASWGSIFCRPCPACSSLKLRSTEKSVMREQEGALCECRQDAGRVL